MLSIGVEEKQHIAGNIQETFVPAPLPRHPLAQKMLKCWHNPPADGFQRGRDLPLTDPEHPLSYVIVWQPVEGGRDFIAGATGAPLIRQCGRDIAGCRMSELVSPELTAYIRHISQTLHSEARIETLDVCQSHNGFDYLHYEMVLCSVGTTDGPPALITGLYYF